MPPPTTTTTTTGHFEVLTGSDVLVRLADDWDRLWQVTEPPAPMLEGEWIRRWWRQHGAGGRLEPCVAVLWDDAGKAQAIAPLYRRGSLDKVSRGLRTMHLMGMGELEADEVFGEYHTWLGPAAARDALSTRLLAWLSADKRWDRLDLPNLSPESMITERLVRPLAVSAASVAMRRFPTFRSPAMPQEAYLAALPSPKMRHKVRRSLKEMASRGLQFERAATLDEARVMLRELGALHQRQWESRGRPGVFASAVFRAFHEDMLPYYARGGRLWLVGLRQGKNIVAARYLMEARGRLYDYISGLEGTNDNLLNPGLCLHMLAIDRAAAEGVKIYDFMGGDYDYKRRLAIEEAEQIHAEVIRGNARSYVWLSARAMQRWIREKRRPASASSVAGGKSAVPESNGDNERETGSGPTNPER